MVGLRTLERTAVFAWSSGSGPPLLATGTKVGALSDDFSSEIVLELWDLALDKQGQDVELDPLGTITTDSGFNDIAWSEPDDDHPLGVIAGALENGAVDLWDAQKLRDGGQDAFISRTTKHTGAVKALQWNPYRHNLLASVGAKGEIYIYDVNTMANPFRLGATAARADDIDCVDWNKSEKTAHILATGSSGGFVTVWDVKQKKDVLTLSNQGRKAVSAVAWDPEQSTTLATATSNDQEPLILIWSLRNSSAPERTLKGHQLGVLGLSWCLQDPELLLSCGKDNRTVCWNAKTAEKYGDFTAGSNWAFQTRWNPHNPSLIASASFDGKVLVTSIQSTNSKPEQQAQANQSLDGEDFFAKAQTQPQGITFTLPKAPKWAARPSTVSFGFGGKLIRVSTDLASRKSKVAIETFAVDTSMGESAQKFEEKLKGGDVASICASKIEEAKTDEERADWQVIETLNTGKSRKKVREYLGFDEDELAKETEKLDINGEKDAKPETNGDDFFGNGENGDNFLADLAATKGTKTNNPFSIYTGSESDADKSVTRALMLGQFEKALDVCLREDRMSDAFMIAVCGGQKCIDKAQNAYLKKKAHGPNYLRLLASIVGKNLWDVVHNADLNDWKDVMATICTYADETEFSDLCEALGDRLEEALQGGEGEKARRRDASFCYLTGSRLEKVVVNWVQELREQEQATLEEEGAENSFSVHAKCLQQFIEKVTVFRQVTDFRDSELQASDSWRLAELYRLYAEYAEILAASGQLASAEQYLDLLPSKYNGAEAAQTRIRQATKKTTAAAPQQRQTAAAQRPAGRVPSVAQPAMAAQQPLINQARNSPAPYMPPNAAQAAAPQGPYAPASTPNTQRPYAPPANNYAPAGYQPPQAGTSYGQQPGAYGGYQPPQQAPLPPPPRANASSPAGPPAAATRNMSNWNDMPDNFFKDKPNSRRGTPAPQAIASPFPNAQGQLGSPPPPPTGPPQLGQQQRGHSPLPPPPKAGEAPPRITSPPAAGFQQQQGRPQSSSAANAYAPAPGSQQSPAVGSTLPTPGPPPIQRGASPYQPPPSRSTAAPSNRYAPAPGSQPSLTPGAPPPQRQVAPNPYAAQQPPQQSPYAPQQGGQYGQPQQMQGGPPPKASGPPPQGPPRSQVAPSQAGPPPQGPPRNTVASPSNQQPSLPQTPLSPLSQQPEYTAPPARPKYPRGDRSHISPSAQPIVDLLTPEISRIRSAAPQMYKPQVDDMEKRLNILFDHLNNEDLLSEDTVGEMVEIARAVQARDWERAQGLFNKLQAERAGEVGAWVVGVKRLINFGKVSKA
ncbi:protein transport protein S31 [Vermiconidia calcicola]|uniref:Protein transport protein S31 n=1 Tax=Vermiconidia calcicola TaxID=1690605 RepID=A0ACC3MHN2_9PEZI|nr:protein transport protein S31 [Vermiconidia calcicola]